MILSYQKKKKKENVLSLKTFTLHSMILIILIYFIKLIELNDSYSMVYKYLKKTKCNL